MLAYRVFPHLPGARATKPGNARYVPPQGHGRFDNPDRYQLRYLALDPVTAVVEAFGGLAWWTPAMFRVPALPGAARKLATLTLPDAVRLVDLDDPHRLAEREIRPTEVMAADRAVTQELALRLFEECRWDGIRWWSTWPQHAPVIAVWSATMGVRKVEPLNLDHPAVAGAATFLAKPLRAAGPAR